MVIAAPLLLVMRVQTLALIAAMVLVLVLVLAVVLPRRRAALAADDVRYPGLVDLRRTTTTCRVTAVLLGGVVLVAVAGSGPLGRGLALAPAAFAAVQVAGVLVADLLTRDSARRPGAASLEVRRVRDYLPRRLVTVVGALAAVLLAELAWAAAVASQDDLGRPGRALAYRCSAGCDGGAHTPWPGSFYAVPLVVGLVGVVLAGALAVRQTVRRPRDGSDAQVVRLDDAVRRRSVEAVVAGIGTAFAAGLVGIALAAGAPVLADPGVPAALRAGAGVLVAAGCVALPLLAWCVVVVLMPTAASAPTGRGTRA